MTEKKPSFISVIRNYVLKIGGLLKEEIHEPKLEFGLHFIYPNNLGNPMTVVQLKKKEYIEISFPIKIGEKHIEVFKGLNKVDKRNFMKTLQKKLLQTGLLFNYDFQQRYMISLVDKLFIDNDRISLNDFFKSVQRVYSQAVAILIFVQDFFSDEFIFDDSVFR